MFTPNLTLTSQGKRFTLTAITEVPNDSFSAGSAEIGAPEASPVGAGVVACQLRIEHTDQPSAQLPKSLEHRLPGLTIKSGQTLTAFVILDGRVLGSASLILSGEHVVALPRKSSVRSTILPVAANMLTAAAQRPPLTGELCQAITVRNTPDPGSFTGPLQTLDKLGVIDDIQARAHKSAIQQDLNQIGWHIQQSDIQSGPAKTVRDCSDSVQNNAF